jgi:RNA polymerase sigma-70 factor (ECF subfamily)
MGTMASDYACKLLFEKIGKGDEAAFREFFELYRSRVYHTAFKLTKSTFAAEEITQNTFISIWTGRAHLAEVRDPMSYLHTALYNKISRHLKKEANKTQILRMWRWNEREWRNETEEMVYANEGQRFINRALAQLSPQKKLIYELSRKEGKSYDEIAETLHLSPHTVKSHLVKALKFIRNYMKHNALILIACISAWLS